MLRNVRKKVASSISKIEEVEDFQYSSWLKVSTNEGVEIGNITSKLQDTSYVTYNINEPALNAFVIGFNDSEVRPEFKEFYFQKIKSNAVFFMMHTVPVKGIHLSEIEPKPQGYVAKDVDFLIPYTAVREHGVILRAKDVTDYKVKFDVPQITDHLESMKPKVRNIELLNTESLSEYAKSVQVTKYELDPYTGISAVQDVKLEKFGKVKVKKHDPDAIKKAKKIYKVKIPGMGNFAATLSELKINMIQPPEVFESVVIRFAEVPSWSSSVTIDHTIPYKFYDYKDEELIELNDYQVNEFKDPHQIKDVLKLILKNIQKIEWDKRKDLHFPLKLYEEEGAKFLVENDIALLQDEFGLDKIKETAAALKFHFGNRSIRSALIVTSKNSIGSKELSEKFDIEDGWIGCLAKWCPELPVVKIDGTDDERNDLWQKSSLIYLVDHETAARDFHLNYLSKNILNKFDCVVLDEVQLLMNSGEKATRFLSSVKSKVMWNLTSIVDEEVERELSILIGEQLNKEQVKIRKKKDVKEFTQSFRWQEYWLSADEEQQTLYKETVKECQKDLRKILETGNPYRFQANIFTLIHKLKQVCNFTPGNTSSHKTELLLKHLSVIKQNGRKALIISQYDRHGTRKIEKFLEQSGINYILAPAGLSVDEMAKSVSLFKSKKEITAFVTDAKISRLKFGDAIIPYIIKFDQWWNPVALWEVEDMFNINEQNEFEGVNVLSYNTAHSIDEEVKAMLTEKGYTDKNILEMMPAKVFDDLISVDDWLKVFKMPVNEEPPPAVNKEAVLKKLKGSTLNYFRSALSKLFFKLGYTNLDILDELNSSSYNLVGEAKRNNRNIYLFARVIMEDKVLIKDVKEIITQSGSSPNSKIFVITKGRFTKGCERFETGNVTLLDGFKLADYLIRLNIFEKEDLIDEEDNETGKDAKIKPDGQERIKWID